MTLGANNFKKLVGNLLSVAMPTFGEEIEYRPVSGGRFRFVAVFDRNFQKVDPDTEAVVSTNQPRLGIKLSDIPREPCQNDQVKVLNSDTNEVEFYKVTEIQEDGQGGCALWLNKLNE